MGKKKKKEEFTPAISVNQQPQRTTTRSEIGTKTGEKRQTTNFLRAKKKKPAGTLPIPT